MNSGDVDSELEDSDDFTVDLEKQAASKLLVKERIDQYLTATRLGRLAFIAGDVQLAKDRFNLAMSLEMQTEFDNNGDFGVTGGLLKNEMITRCASHVTASGGGGSQCVSERLGSMLYRLSQVFEHADTMLGHSPGDSKWYLVMASCLCMINEWGKAEIVYREGLKACPNDRQLLKSLTCLHNVMDSINELTKKAGLSATEANSTEATSNSHYLAMNIISAMSGGSSSSTNRRPVNRVVRRKFGSLPGDRLGIPPSSQSRISNKILYGPYQSMATPPLSPRSRSKSVMAPSNHSHMTKRFSVQQLSGNHQLTLWQSLFSPSLQAQILSQGFSSNTLETMRTINKLAIVDLSALRDQEP